MEPVVAELDDHFDSAVLPPGSPTPNELVIGIHGVPEVVVYRPSLSVRVEPPANPGEPPANFVDVSLDARPPTVVTLPENPVAIPGARHMNPPVMGGESAFTCGMGMTAFKAPGDEFLDLIVVGESGRFYVAYGIGDGTFHHDLCELGDVPTMIPASNQGAPITAVDTCMQANVIEAGHLDLDGSIDIVTDRGVWLTSLLGGPEAGGLCDEARPYYRPQENLAPWTLAAIADFDGDDLLDLLATPLTGGIDFMAGSGSTRLTFTHIAGNEETRALTLGDFDADGITDAATATAISATQDRVSVAFGELFAPPSEPLDLGNVDKGFSLAAYDVGLIDSATDLVVGSETEDGRFVGVIAGKPSRFLQLPFSMSYEFPTDEVHLPLSIASGRFAAPDQLHVAMWALDTGFRQPPDALYGLGIAEARGDLKLTLLGELSLVPDHGLGTGAVAMAAIDLDDDAIDELVVISSSGEFDTLPPEQQLPAELLVLVPELDDSFNWSAAEPLAIPAFGLIGQEALDDANNPASVLIDGAESQPQVCVLEAGKPPSLIVGVTARQPCADGNALAKVTQTQLLVLSPELLGAIRRGEAPALPAEAFIEPPEGESIVGFTCLNANADPHQEIAMLTVDAPLSSCEAMVDEQTLNVELVARVHALQFIGGAASPTSLVAEIRSDVAPSLLVRDAARKPLSGLASGDVDGDGVDDLVLGAGEQTVVLRGRPVNP
jgi:hypothetical protein